MNKIALGSVQFGLEYGVSSGPGKVKSEEVKKILSYAASKNIDLIDTAFGYGNSEKILGNIKINKNFQIVTKTRYFDNNKITENDLMLLKKDFYASLEKLKTNSVYGLLIHNPSDIFKPNAEKLFETLKELKKIKKIKKLGVSTYNLKQLRYVLENFRVDIVQLPLNIFDRRVIDSGILKELNDKGIEVHARSIFLQGLLLMPKEKRPNKFNHWDDLWNTWHQWLKDNKITALEATLKYATSIPEISKIVVGVDSKTQLEEIISALFSNVSLPRIPPELYTKDLNLINPSNWSKL